MITVKDIRKRIEAICSAIPEIKTVIVEDDDGNVTYDNATLPAVIVFSRRANRLRQSGDSWTVTRNFHIGLLFSRLDNGLSRSEQIEQAEIAEEFMEVIPDYFLRKARKLEFGDQGLMGVIETAPMTDEGLELRSHGKDSHIKNYYSVTYTLPVTYNRR